MTVVKESWQNPCAPMWSGVVVLHRRALIEVHYEKIKLFDGYICRKWMPVQKLKNTTLSAHSENISFGEFFKFARYWSERMYPASPHLCLSLHNILHLLYFGSRLRKAVALIKRDTPVRQKGLDRVECLTSPPLTSAAINRAVTACFKREELFFISVMFWLKYPPIHYLYPLIPV